MPGFGGRLPQLGLLLSAANGTLAIAIALSCENISTSYDEHAMDLTQVLDTLVSISDVCCAILSLLSINHIMAQLTPLINTQSPANFSLAPEGRSVAKLTRPGGCMGLWEACHVY